MLYKFWLKKFSAYCYILKIDIIVPKENSIVKQRFSCNFGLVWIFSLCEYVIHICRIVMHIRIANTLHNRLLYSRQKEFREKFGENFTFCKENRPWFSNKRDNVSLRHSRIKLEWELHFYRNFSFAASRNIEHWLVTRLIIYLLTPH